MLKVKIKGNITLCITGIIKGIESMFTKYRKIYRNEITNNNVSILKYLPLKYNNLFHVRGNCPYYIHLHTPHGLQCELICAQQEARKIYIAWDATLPPAVADF